MTPLDSLGSVIGAPVRVGDIRVGEVAGVLVDASQRTAIGLVIAGPGAMRRFLPWIAATFEGGAVHADSALLLVDGSESYERRGAVVVDVRSRPCERRGGSRRSPVRAGRCRFAGRRGGYAAGVIRSFGHASRHSAIVVLDVEEDADNVARRMARAIGAGERTLVVDLGDSDHASADLLTVLHGTAGRLRALGGRLGVVVTQPDLRRLLDLTLLSRGFAVFSTRDEALSRWG